jgi:hypothetical protein
MRLMLGACAALLPAVALAHGALAVGLPTSVEREGFAYGVTWDYANQSVASDTALTRCRDEDALAKNHCRVLKVFTRECVAVVMDPDPGTSGVGWAFGDTKDAAIADATKMCHETAGAVRRDYCKLSNAQCDTTP